jgi:pyruvate,water dikinase
VPAPDVTPHDAQHVHTQACEAVWGLGEALVSGEVTPHHRTFDWSLGVTTNESWTPQKVKYTPTPGGGGIMLVSTTPDEHERGPLSDALLELLVASGHNIAASRKAPQDIEWCFDGRTIFVVQTVS